MNYGLERQSEDTEIHVFRVILQTSLDKTACTRSVTPAGPMSDPIQTLEQIIEAWWDLEVETQNHSWKLTAVNGALSWSPNKDLLNPVYVLTRKGDPFHLQHAHFFLNPSRARHDSSDGQEILSSSSYVLDKPPDIMS